MASWEYKVVPAPTKGRKGKGIKGAEGRFAFALESLMNEMAADGWEFQRAETLPSIERSGLTSTTTEWRNLMVFRRAVTAALDDFEPELLPAPDAVALAAVPAAAAAAEVAAQSANVENGADDASFQSDDSPSQEAADEGDAGTSDMPSVTTPRPELRAHRTTSSDT